MLQQTQPSSRLCQHSVPDWQLSVSTLPGLVHLEGVGYHRELRAAVSQRLGLARVPRQRRDKLVGVRQIRLAWQL